MIHWRTIKSKTKMVSDDGLEPPTFVICAYHNTLFSAPIAHIKLWSQDTTMVLFKGLRSPWGASASCQQNRLLAYAPVFRHSMHSTIWWFRQSITTLVIVFAFRALSTIMFLLLRADVQPSITKAYWSALFIRKLHPFCLMRGYFGLLTCGDCRIL